MKKDAFKMILVPLVLAACLHNDRAVCTHAQLKTILLDNVKQEHHWRDMWFELFNYDGQWHEPSRLRMKNHRYSTSVKLKMLCRMMGCAYGARLNYFFLLTFKTVDECNEMQRRGNDNGPAELCKNALKTIVARSKSVILKVIRALKGINAAIKNDIDNDPFYKALFTLEDFAKGPANVEFSAALPGGPIVFELFHTRAESLRVFLQQTCAPDFKLFDITKLRDDYRRSNRQDRIYAFYLDQLNSYIDYVEKHITQLFHCPDPEHPGPSQDGVQ